MNRRFWLFLTSPTLLIGVCLIVACSVSMLAIQSLQNRLNQRINAEVVSLRAAHEMEVALRQLRFHFFLNLLKPTSEHLRETQADHEQFERALARAKEVAPSRTAPLLETIEKNYRAYKASLTDDNRPPDGIPRKDLLAWIDEHPIRQVVDPCQELLERNQELVENALVESAESARTTQITLALLGIVGPIGGLLAGYAITRNLSRSIARLQVRVQDVHSQLAPEVGVVDLHTGHALDSMDAQLQTILGRVQGLVERLQEHQKAAIRSKQLAAVGQLASSMAHEIRNPLTAMRWLVDAAIQSYPDEPMRIQDLEVLQTEIERMNLSVQQVLDFVRPAPAQRCREDLCQVVRQALALTQARKRQLGITCKLDLPAEPVWVELDAAQIKLVVVNLVLNALEAMPRGGNLTVKVQVLAGNKAELIVEDTGPGIPAKILGEMFQPFVTTKSTGTGLGLNVSHRIVAEHQGSITAQNRPEGGACFRIVLPMEPARAAILQGA
jgi:two-component system, NtrC family, sensor histidine kinase HydH